MPLLMFAAPRGADAIRWGKGLTASCEPPATFYGLAHQTGRPPCCASQPGMCPGGTVCPGNGICPGAGERCQPAASRTRPNIILVISDDQGDCHYGAAGECRSVQTGTPIPAPPTPNLDVLAGHGTVFPIAHNTAAWCYPSLNSILTGRYQRSMRGNRNLSETFHTVPSVLRTLEGEAGATPDPYDPESAVGGYCTFLGGKFTGAGGKTKFDAQARLGYRRLGKLPCTRGAAGQPPECGTGNGPGGDPLELFAMRDLFEFMDANFHQVPGRPGVFTTQPFFAWYAPRIPHAPLRAPEPVEEYLFGPRPGLGGLFQLGTCASGGCSAVVRAFDESNIGTQREFYGSVWWADDNLREIRKYLARKSAPHCILRDGSSRFSATSPPQCPTSATWATEFAPPVEANTVLIYLSDNGWFLPDSKHNFTENGYRTRLFVYDPRVTSAPWRAAEAAPLPPNESPGLAHATDVLPTVLGLALDTPGPQACPESADGTPCDGRALRPYLRGAAAAPAEPLRHALCGHETRRGSSPGRQRYLLTRPGSVGRCVDVTLPACSSAADCAGGELCLGGRCTPNTNAACGSTAQCPKGSLCLGGRCTAGAPCLDDVSCIAAYQSFAVQCAERETRWCRNAPNQGCTTAADCPACPGTGAAAACGRVCEPRVMKLYLGRNGDEPEYVDLFTDPDERGRRYGGDAVYGQMSSPGGPYAADLRRLSCCLDDWWAEGIRGGTLCGAADACPADFVCNE